MTSSSTVLNWRDEFERSFEQVKQSMEAELARTRETARADGSRGAAEWLNQATRRMRQTNEGSELLSILVETSSPLCGRAAAIVLDGTRGYTS